MHLNIRKSPTVARRLAIYLLTVHLSSECELKILSTIACKLDSALSGEMLEDGSVAGSIVLEAARRHQTHSKRLVQTVTVTSADRLKRHAHDCLDLQVHPALGRVAVWEVLHPPLRKAVAPAGANTTNAAMVIKMRSPPRGQAVGPI